MPKRTQKTMPRSGLLVLVALLALSLASSVSAVPIELKYSEKAKNPIKISDLSVFPNANQTGNETIVLVAGVAADDVTLQPGGSLVRNTDKDGKALPAWKSWIASYTDAKGEHIYKGGDVQTASVFGLFTPDATFALFVGLLEANINAP